VVLAILSILFFIVTPRFFSSLNPAKVKTFVQRLQNTLLYVNEKAILEKKVYLFTLDLDERKYFFTISEMGNPEGKVNDRYLIPVVFPKILQIESVQLIPGDTVDDGSVVIPFTPKGMLYSFEVRVREGSDRGFVLRGDSLSNDVTLTRVRDEGFF
jgi:type II secretory pathway pseudopilin PulG